MKNALTVSTTKWFEATKKKILFIGTSLLKIVHIYVFYLLGSTNIKKMSM